MLIDIFYLSPKIIFYRADGNMFFCRPRLGKAKKV